MAFSEATKDAAYRRSGGQCECTRQDGLHRGRCPVRIPRTGPRVQFNHKHAARLGGGDGLTNCEALCTPCHQATASYGRH